MLLYVILILGTWNSVLGKDDICDRDLPQVCILNGDRRFPANEADIDRMCPQMIQDIDCMDDYSRRCSPGNDPKQRFRQNLRDVVEEGCRKDSQLHSRIVQNIHCIHETVQNDFQTCQEYLKEKEEALTKHINRLSEEKGYGEDEYAEELYAPYRCLVHSLETACIAAKATARCGSDTGDLLFDIVDRVGALEQFCVPVNEEQLAEYITLLEFELEQETSLNRILGKE